MSKHITFVGVMVLSLSYPRQSAAQTQETEAAKIAQTGRFPRSRLMRKDASGNVVTIQLGYCTDKEIEAVDFRVFKHLKSLWIKRAEGDRTIAHLAKMESELSFLAIFDSPIRDKELMALLRGQKALVRLWIIDTKITDGALVEIAKLPNLLDLQLRNNSLTDEGAKHVAKLEQLYNLDLSDTKLTDKGLRELKALEGLGSLYIRGNNITDEGLRDSCEQERLVPTPLRIRVDRTKATEKGRKSLEKFRPAFQVEG
jgi:hypothetical protein